MEISIGEIIKCTNGQLIEGNTREEIKRISTDSRDIKENDMFIALIGENFDGHKFLKSAASKGAKTLLVSQYKNHIEGVNVIKVEDTLKAMEEIAKYYISKFHILKVAVTGSTGKTTTKDMIYNVLRKKYKVLKNKGNFNNHIGLPKTVFELDSTYEACILEMGMSGFDEIDLLANIVRPHIGVITNVGLSHIERLGSQENICKAKMEIKNYFNEKDMLILNGDDKFLCNIEGDKYNVLKVGLNKDMDLRGEIKKDLGQDGILFSVIYETKTYDFRLNVAGIHNVYNAMSAIMIGIIEDIPMDKIREAISEFESGNMRLNIKENGEILIIDDTYNASPDSMEAGINVLKNVGKNRKIAILGDMLEMGEYAKDAHENVGYRVSEENIDVLIAVGNDAIHYKTGAMKKGMGSDKTFFFKSNQEVMEFLKDFLKEDDTFLIKGSRGMKMEELVKYLQERR
ncbi:MAG: UDP-N-acetylmuramoyl-tripeptide--D-alanyl-D-alanine ligase [Anaeromicrobium sp.]|jgi:UDP-N-acetylmuramoyl-tripeptide--D-alanyl-D-alanine ligase|uniref:UDP-N-acetylmuramoyl-tripeptide--D-alanyl-D- alanine ligase n=1 Tax=Anaeromicrobium sp. TaxID=1929132 RepID=UPI0025E39FEB|nr:UDP-N-acetylmuramoyl-tripeptide--D-alanyl-D-alanine ligase [Anaeromicrobium sp.]MCT4594382.1 UDP-N-acetylmuramoyl-tripeptide--D-alanyl-D-alanine ligase [Anaeromicrobium sp.]